MPSSDKAKRQENFFDVCSNCQTHWSCCHETTPPITLRRKKIIETFLKQNKINLENAFAREGHVFPKLDSDGYCIFHDRKTKKCLVHPVKPETCVAGPITFDINVKTGKIEWFVKMDTICPLAGLVYRDKASLEKHLQSAKKEISRLVKETDAQDLKAILKKDEPETFKIGESKTSKRTLNNLRTEREKRQDCSLRGQVFSFRKLK
jgi:Fe-S-cluster containining protein